VGAQVFAVDSTYYDATNSIIDVSNPVGTQWHELHPNYCTGPYTLIDWRDNGDGVLSHCDTVLMQAPDMTESWEHVVEVTYTVELTPVAEPIIENFWDYDYHEQASDPLEDPVCSWWVEIYPDFGVDHHIISWEDNGNDTLDFCDMVVDHYGFEYHVEGVHTDMVTEPPGGSATDRSTWSKIKSLFD
jgi:hypothetical protein